MSEDLDYFGDGDLAAPENLPEKQRFVGKITGVVTEESEIGHYKKFEAGKLKDGRTEVPVISVKVRAFGYADGRQFPEEANFVQSTSQDFWVGKEDKAGRHSLANLIRKITALADEELKAMRMQDGAKQLNGAAISFEVRHRAGRDGAVFQGAVSIKPATPEEAVMLA
jgi:hypothetical protein